MSPRGGTLYLPGPVDRLRALAIALAKPVILRQLPGRRAYAALAAAAFEAGQDDALAGLWQTLKSHAQWLRRERDFTRGMIWRAAEPLIAQRRPRNEIRAAAHDINGGRGFLLTEAEVEDELLNVVWTALPKARGRVAA